ncbi:hypothetical protein ATANTOWER_028024 [Ataeniobius toweri]|uniref:Uncharacterized protein n=1 Tax=Ataeniobius toweri TaxID=208326 RepID=A0ABU7C7A4_9TELE|nr:hypothetical protein [Ataeniobius toweri]
MKSKDKKHGLKQDKCLFSFCAPRGFHPVSYLPLSDPTARPSQAEFNLQAKSGQLSQFRANTPQEEVRPDCNIDQADIIQ